MINSNNWVFTWKFISLISNSVIRGLNNPASLDDKIRISTWAFANMLKSWFSLDSGQINKICKKNLKNVKSVENLKNVKSGRPSLKWNKSPVPKESSAFKKGLGKGEMYFLQEYKIIKKGYMHIVSFKAVYSKEIVTRGRQ